MTTKTNFIKPNFTASINSRKRRRVVFIDTIIDSSMKNEFKDKALTSFRISIKN